MAESMEILGGFLCYDCNDGKIFQFLIDLLAHYRAIHPRISPPRFRCSVCLMVSEDEKSIWKHLMEHYKYRRYSCLKCQHCRLETKLDITLHLLRAHEEKMLYFCRICGESFPSELNVIKHGESRHSAYVRSRGTAASLVQQLDPGSREYMEIRGGLICCLCSVDVIFQTTSDLKAHHDRSTHRKYPVQFMCSDCCFKCDSEPLMNQHLMEHFSYERYMCLECPGRTFPDEYEIKRHLIEAHRVKMLYSCPICGNSFPSALNVIKHMLSRYSNRLRVHNGPLLSTIRFNQRRVLVEPSQSNLSGNLSLADVSLISQIAREMALVNINWSAESSQSNLWQNQSSAVNPAPQNVGETAAANYNRTAESSRSDFSENQSSAVSSAPRDAGQATALNVTSDAESSHNQFLQTEGLTVNTVQQDAAGHEDDGEQQSYQRMEQNDE